MSAIKSLMVAAVATAGLGSVAAQAQSAPPTPVYLAKAGASDLFEIRSSRLMLQSTHNPQIRRFANKMITDHTKSTAMVKAAAMRAGLHPHAPMLDAEQQSNYTALMQAHGADRDRLFLQQQQASHQQALELQQDEANGGTVPGLKRTAGEIVPIVQQHIQMLGQISG